MGVPNAQVLSKGMRMPLPKLLCPLFHKSHLPFVHLSTPSELLSVCVYVYTLEAGVLVLSSMISILIGGTGFSLSFNSLRPAAL